MKILVTGVAGFIGMNVAHALIARGDEVVGIDSLNAYYSVQLKRDRIAHIERLGGAFRFAQVDFDDHTALDGALASDDFERVVHLGAQAGVRYSLEQPRAYIAANVLGHLNILELARLRGVAHLVYASSSSVYGGNSALPFSTDDRVDRPLSLYAATKRADELMSETYAHLHRLPQTGLRFFTVYGPWGRPDMAMWLFTRAILAGEAIHVYNHGEMFRDFTYIDDIVAGVLAVLDTAPADNGAEKPGGSRSPHSLYNIGNSRSERLGDVIDLIERACGRPAIRSNQPIQPGDAPATCADISAIERDLGYSPTTSVDQGIPRFVEWYRAYHGISA